MAMDAAEAPGWVPDAICAAIIAAGRRMDQRGWVPAGAGNISMRLGTDRIAITRSGDHKGFLTNSSVMVVDSAGQAIASNARPSAETLLHCQIYQLVPSAGAVLHGHSVAATVLSMATPDAVLRFSGYEVQKAFAGQATHLATLELKLVDNHQDMALLAALLAPGLADLPMGYLIRGHGVYIWGEDMPRALARLEALEFLLVCELERRRLGE